MLTSALHPEQVAMLESDTTISLLSPAVAISIVISSLLMTLEKWLAILTQKLELELSSLRLRLGSIIISSSCMSSMVLLIFAD